VITKEYTSTGRSCRVTFTIPGEDDIEQVAVLGEFNDWDPGKGKMTRKKDSGHFALTVSLKPGTSYKFRYLVNENSWRNDQEADGSAANAYGSEDSIINI
jgi:1,4-alpha-glucan branching enzyme